MRAHAQRRASASESNAEAIAAAEAHEGVFATVGLPPELGARASTTRGGGDRAARRATRGAGDRRDRASTTTANRRPARSSGAPSRRRSRSPAERDLPIVIHARDPDGETTPTDDVFEILDARGGRGDGDPALLPRPPGGSRTRSSAAGTARSPATSPIPKSERCARPPRRCPTSCSWSRPTRPTSRRSRCAASRTSRRTSSPPREAVAEVRGVSYEELERTVEANARAALRLVRRSGAGSDRTSSPTRTCSTRSSATPRSSPTTSCSRSAPARGR